MSGDDHDGTPECGAIPPNVRGPVPCHLPPGHAGQHFSTTGCTGSEIHWGDDHDGTQLDLDDGCVGFLTPHRHHGRPPGVHFVWDADQRGCVQFRPCPACSRHGWHQRNCPSVQPTNPLGDAEQTPAQIDLDAIEARARDTAHRMSLPTDPLRLAREDVPALVAEVRRLRARFRLCRDCDATETACVGARGGGFIKCCPDCRHDGP